MKKKEFLTEAKRKAIISEKEKAIIESFTKTFNKIKRIDENEINENINTLANILQNKGSLDHLKNNDRIRLKLIDGEFLKKNPEWKDKSLNFLFYDARSHMVGVELIGTGKSGNAYPEELVIDLEQTNINEFEEENPVYSRMQQHNMNYEKDYLNLEDENTYKVEVIGKEDEKDGGSKHRWVYEITANSEEEAEAKAADKFNENWKLSDIYLFSAKVISNPTDNDVVQGRGVKLSEEGLEDGRDDEPDRDYDDRDYGREFGGEDGW
jgi:hypothetical protein